MYTTCGPLLAQPCGSNSYCLTSNIILSLSQKDVLGHGLGGCLKRCKLIGDVQKLCFSEMLTGKTEMNEC